jgi:DNA polymerase III subunit delta
MATSGAPILVLGDEELLVARGVAAAVTAARALDPATSSEEFPASELTVGQLLAAVSPSLFGDGRVVVIRDGQDAKKELAAAILAYAAAPEPGVTLVVTHAGGAKGKALADGLREAGASVVSAAKITKVRDRIDFVRDEVRRLGGKCSEDAADALLTAVGNDLRELASACSQLVADTGGRIDAVTVARYYRGRAQVSGFTVADAAIVGDLPGALEALRWALQTGVDPVPIADALADGVRTISRVASAGRGSAFQLASSLGMPPWKIERAQKQSRGWSGERLAEATLITAECNAAVKGGAEDRGYALERAVFGLVAARTAGDSRSGGRGPAGSPGSSGSLGSAGSSGPARGGVRGAAPA